MQTLTGLPDLDRTVGRAFLQRASASEFVTAMAAFAALPRDLLGAVDSTADRSSEDASMLEASSLGGVKSVLLRGTLRTACDPEVRASCPSISSSKRAWHEALYVWRC